MFPTRLIKTKKLDLRRTAFFSWFLFYFFMGRLATPREKMLVLIKKDKHNTIDRIKK